MVRVCPPRDFDFSNVSTGTETIVVAERIDASQYDTIDVIVRVHTATTISTNGAIAVQVVSDGYTADDPSQDFFGSTIGNGTTLSGTLAAGGMTVESLSASIGSMVAVRVVGTAGSGAVTARLSIDLAMKTC
ncbi:MAG: hypothetical protein H6719_31410 [Sandaracinaceae bacterium]|nr:hypothetical protein [Sandaracinaceae bacterium]